MGGVPDRGPAAGPLLYRRWACCHVQGLRLERSSWVIRGGDELSHEEALAKLELTRADVRREGIEPPTR